KVEAQHKIDEALSDRRLFARLKALEMKRKEIDDPVTARAIRVLYLQYLEKQIDLELLRKMVERANAVEEQFNRFRARTGGKELTDNEVRRVLMTSTDSGRLRSVWEA